VPGSDSFRFVFLADCQLGAYATFSGMTEEDIVRLEECGMWVEAVPFVEGFEWDAIRYASAIDAVNSLRPEFVVIGGDMIDDSSSAVHPKDWLTWEGRPPKKRRNPLQDRRFRWWSGTASIRRPLVVQTHSGCPVRLSVSQYVPFPGVCEMYWDVVRRSGFAERHLEGTCATTCWAEMLNGAGTSERTCCDASIGVGSEVVGAAD
jgi:hypothetical protein